MKHELPPLPYAANALEPHMSRETLEFHHGKHHKAYVDKLNELIAGTRYESMPLEEIVQDADGEIFNNAAQVWNHDFFWRCLTPSGQGMPREIDGELAQAIDAEFGSFDDFKAEFAEQAAANFGSGWTWLICDEDGELSIVNTSDAHTPMEDGATPLLTCDVWEHAYYIDYRNKRPDYLKAFWNIVDWSFVGAQYEQAQALA